MFKHSKTGITFENRKQAIILIGQNRYKKLLRLGEFEWDNDNCLKNESLNK